MSEMVSGTDVIFEIARQGFDFRELLDAVLDVWPDGCVQNAAEVGVRPLQEVPVEPDEFDSQEFFVYRDAASAKSWVQNGWTEEHSNDMAHFLVVEDPFRAEMLQLTLVIGTATGETIRLIGSVSDALRQMSMGKLEHRKRTTRVNWEASLRAVGYTEGREPFYDQVEELSNRFFPDWTADDLACHPHEALQFCELVRRIVAPVPDHLVMKALMNRRRQGKKNMTMVEPRMVWGG